MDDDGLSRARRIRCQSDRNVLRRSWRELLGVARAVDAGLLIADPADRAVSARTLAAACDLIAGVGERLSLEVGQSWEHE